MISRKKNPFTLESSVRAFNFFKKKEEDRNEDLTPKEEDNCGGSCDHDKGGCSSGGCGNGGPHQQMDEEQAKKLMEQMAGGQGGSLDEKLDPKLEEIMMDTWKSVREKFFHPPLKNPNVLYGKDAEACPTAAIDMKSFQVSISKKFIDEHVTDNKLDPDKFFMAVFGHEVGHYIYCPYDLKNFLLLDYEAGKISKEHSKTVCNLYMDVIDNLYNMYKKQDMHIEYLYKTFFKGEKKIDRLLKSFYQHHAPEFDMGIELDPNDDVDKVLIEKQEALKTIDFFDEGNWRRNAIKFARIIKDLVEEDPDAAGEASMDTIDADDFDENQKKQAVREVAKEIKNPKDFKELMEKHDLCKEAGTEEGDQDEAFNIWYYDVLSENYNMKIKKKPLMKSGSLYPHRHKDYEIGSETESIDVFNSMGKYALPGITKQWVKEDMETYHKAESTPNGIIMIDSSGSMTNPKQGKSYAVLGGFCAAKLYINNGSEVAGINFSAGKPIVQEFTRDKKKIFKNLAHYQGHGTDIDIQSLDDLVQDSDKDVDIVLITDMQISNYDETIDYLKNQHKNNRTTIIHIGGHGETRHEQLGKNIHVYSVQNEEDIPKIVIGDTHKSIGAK